MYIILYIFIYTVVRSSIYIDIGNYNEDIFHIYIRDIDI